MRSKVIVLVVVFIFDILDFGFAVAAEQRRASASFDRDEEGRCCPVRTIQKLALALMQCFSSLLVNS
ncbi:hypothetical protein ACHQM5_003060 [Ranunculus cassubicifolius]